MAYQDIQKFIIDEKDQKLVLVEVDLDKECNSPDINHFCRFCSRNMRYRGALSNTLLVFTNKTRGQKTISERLAGLGLELNPSNKKRSTRICRTCVRAVDNMERWLAVLQKWKEDEAVSNETSTPALPPELTSDQSAPPESSTETTKEEPPKKKLRKPRTSLTNRQSVTSVITTYPNGNSHGRVASNREAGIIHNIAIRNWETAANLIYSHKELFDEIKTIILIAISKQCQKLINPNNGFMLWKSSPDDLKSFSFDKLILELERMAPFLLSIFNTISKRNPGAACASLCIALRGRLPAMSAFAYHINSIIARGGIKKAVFNELSAMAITTSYSYAKAKQREIKRTRGSAGLDTQPKVESPSELSETPEVDMDNSADTYDLRTDYEDSEPLSDSITNEELPT